MEIHIVANREFIVSFVNEFIAENQLMFFIDRYFEKDGLITGKQVDESHFVNKDIAIQIGRKEDFEGKIKLLNTRPAAADKVNFIYMLSGWVANEVKVCDTYFAWEPAKSEMAKSLGKLLKKKTEACCHLGMEAADERYAKFNQTFRKFYWPVEALNYKDKLFNSGGVVKLKPIEQV